MTASLQEFVYGPVTRLLQTLRDLYNLYSEIQEEKREALMEHKGTCTNRWGILHMCELFIQDIVSYIPGNSGTSAPSLLQNSAWTLHLWGYCLSSAYAQDWQSYQQRNACLETHGIKSCCAVGNILKNPLNKSYYCNKVKHFREQLFSLFFPAEWTRANYDYKRLAESGNQAHRPANHKCNCFHFITVIASLVLVCILPSLLCNSSLRSGLIIVWLGSPLIMKE